MTARVTIANLIAPVMRLRTLLKLPWHDYPSDMLWMTKRIRRRRRRLGMGMKMRMMRVHCGGGGGVVNHVGVTGRAFGASASVLISLRLSSHEFCVHTVAAVIRVTMVPMTPWKPSLLQVLKVSSPADCDLEELQVHDVSRSDSEPQLRASALYSLPTRREGALNTSFWEKPLLRMTSCRCQEVGRQVGRSPEP